MKLKPIPTSLYRAWFNMFYGWDQARIDEAISDLICDRVAERGKGVK